VFEATSLGLEVNSGRAAEGDGVGEGEYWLLIGSTPLVRCRDAAGDSGLSMDERGVRSEGEDGARSESSGLNGWQ
jgi:hypothetical protein